MWELRGLNVIHETCMKGHDYMGPSECMPEMGMAMLELSGWNERTKWGVATCDYC